MYRAAIFIWLLVALPASGGDRATFSGSAGNYTAFFPALGRLRHHRYELQLRQATQVSSRFSTVLAGRARVETALLANGPFVGDKLPGVRENEAFEAEIREAYLDWLDDRVHVKAGLQLVDWVEALSPYASEILTPLDLRFGAFGDLKANLVPQLALSASHRLGPGRLEWLLLPLPATNRLPTAANGYGYRETVAAAIGADTFVPAGAIPRNLANTELGLRYLLRLDSAELTLLGYRGHHRRPFLGIPEGGTQLVEDFASVTTFGAFFTYAGDAWVLRLQGYVQPSHETVGGERTLGRAVLGFDYVHSSAFKLYSEVFSTRTMVTGGGATSTDQDSVVSVRVVNESVRGLQLKLDTTATVGKAAVIVNPEASLSVGSSSKLSVGVRAVSASDPSSLLAPLRQSSHGYLQFEHFFSIR